MSQDKVFNFLKKQKKPLPARSIAKKIGVSIVSINRSLNKLSNCGMINVITIKKRVGKRYAKCKINHYMRK